MPQQLDLNTLRLILSVVSEGSFSKAAKANSISQPYISQNIKHFEEALGAKIFDRSSYPVKLTPSGELLVQWAKKVLSDEKETIRNVREVSVGNKTKLTIVSSRLRNMLYLPDIINNFVALRPNCRVQLKTASSIEKRINMLTDNEADIMLDMLPYQVDSHYESFKLHSEELLLAIPVDHPALQSISSYRDGVNLADFAGYRFVSCLSHQRYYRILVDACQSVGFSPDIVMEVPDIPAACSTVAAGIGLSLVPEIVQSQRYMSDKLVFCRILDFKSSTDIFVTYNTRSQHKKDMDIFVQMLKADAGI